MYLGIDYTDARVCFPRTNLYFLIQIQRIFYTIYNQAAIATERTLNEGINYNIIEQSTYNKNVEGKDIFNLKNTKNYLEANENKQENRIDKACQENSWECGASVKQKFRTKED